MEFLDNSIDVLTKAFGELLHTETIIVDEHVQRKLSPLRKKAISKYILMALGEKSRGAYFAPIVCSRRDSGILAILDGQHRYFGYLEAIDTLEKDIQKIRTALFTRGSSAEQARKELKVSSNEDLTQLEARFYREELALKKLHQSVFPVVVYEGLTIPQEQQLFHDLNNLGKSAPTSLSMYYNHADLYARIARHIMEQEWFASYIALDRADATSENLFLFSTVVRTVEQFVGKNLDEENYDDVLNETIDLFKMVVGSLPSDVIENANRYLYKDSKVLQAIGGFARRIKEEYTEWQAIVLSALNKVSFLKTNLDFVTIGGALKSEEGFVVFNATGSGITAIIKTLMAYVTNDNLEEAEIAATTTVEPPVESSTVVEEYDGQFKSERLAILSWLESNGGQAGASRSELQKVSGGTREDARLAMQELIESGVVDVEKVPGKSNIYKLNN